jgi:hypothetical protein
MRTLLVAAVAVLAGGTFLAASGGIGPVLASLGGGFGSAIGRLTATPIPSQTFLPPTDSPRIAAPDQPYTNQPSIELRVSVPVEVLGDATAKVRLYLALEGLQPAPVVDVPVGTTSTMTIPFDLTDGRNDITATLFRAGEESEGSPIVTYILDREAPKITVTSPKNNAAVDAPEATIKGTTQAGTSLIALNSGNGTSISAVADREGKFQFGLPLAPGTNEILIKGTDPAGNEGTKSLKIIQGSREMQVRLTASTYRISVSKHPASLQLVVVVSDPAGAPLAGATASFTLQLPGLAPISNTLVTNEDGRAVFTTPIVGTLTTGGGTGTVLVSSDDYGESTDRVSLTFVK